MGGWASFSSKWSYRMKSSGCKPGALVKLHFDPSKHTFQYAYLVTTYLLLLKFSLHYVMVKCIA